MRPTVRIFTEPSQRAADERLQKTRTRIWPAYGPLNCTRASRSTRSRRRAAGELIPEDGAVRLGAVTTVVVPGLPAGPAVPVGPAHPDDPAAPAAPFAPAAPSRPLAGGGVVRTPEVSSATATGPCSARA